MCSNVWMSFCLSFRLESICLVATEILEQSRSFLSQRPCTCCSLCLECFSFLWTPEVSFTRSSTAPSSENPSLPLRVQVNLPLLSSPEEALLFLLGASLTCNDICWCVYLSNVCLPHWTTCSRWAGGTSLGKGPEAGGSWLEAQAGDLCDLEGSLWGEERWERSGESRSGARPWGPSGSLKDKIWILFKDHTCPSSAPVLSRGVTWSNWLL